MPSFMHVWLSMAGTWAFTTSWFRSAIYRRTKPCREWRLEILVQRSATTIRTELINDAFYIFERIFLHFYCPDPRTTAFAVSIVSAFHGLIWPCVMSLCIRMDATKQMKAVEQQLGHQAEGMFLATVSHLFGLTSCDSMVPSQFRILLMCSLCSCHMLSLEAWVNVPAEFPAIGSQGILFSHDRRESWNRSDHRQLEWAKTARFHLALAFWVITQDMPLAWPAPLPSDTLQWGGKALRALWLHQDIADFEQTDHWFVQHLWRGKDDGSEMCILDYTMQQERLLPLLATAYAFHCEPRPILWSSFLAVSWK